MQHTCKQLFHSFLRAREGSIMVMVGLSALVLVMATGMAIDGERMEMLHAKMQSALDASSLAVAQAANQSNGTLTQSQATGIAQAYFNMNFPQGYLGSQPITVSVTPGNNNTFTVAAQTNESMSMMQMAGVSSMPAAAVSESQFTPYSPCSTTTIGACTTGTNESGWYIDSTNPALADWNCINGGSTTFCQLTAPVCGPTVSTCSSGTVGSAPSASGSTTWSCTLPDGSIDCSDATPQCEDGTNGTTASINGCVGGSAVDTGTSGTNDTWYCKNTYTKVKSAQCSLAAPQCGTTVGSCSPGTASTTSTVTGANDTNTDTWSCTYNDGSTSCTDASPSCSTTTIYGCSAGSAIDTSTSGPNDTWYCKNTSTKAKSAQCSLAFPQCGTTAGSCSPGTASNSSNNGTSTTWSCAQYGVSASCTDADPVCSSTNDYQCTTGNLVAGSGSDNGTTTSWQCGSAGMNVSCSLTDPVSGQCGTVPGSCLSGTLSGITSTTYITNNATGVVSVWNSVTNPYFDNGTETLSQIDSWNCVGGNGGVTATCSAPDGTFLPPTDSCYVATSPNYINDDSIAVPKTPASPYPGPILFSLTCQQGQPPCVLPDSVTGDGSKQVFPTVNYVGAGGSLMGGWSQPGVAVGPKTNSIFIGPDAHLVLWGYTTLYINGIGYINADDVVLNIHGPAMIVNSCELFGDGCNSGSIFTNPFVLTGLGYVGPWTALPTGYSSWADFYAAEASTVETYFNKTFGNVTDFTGDTVSMQSLFPQSVRYWSGSSTPNTIPPAYTGSGPVWPGDMQFWGNGGFLMFCDPEQADPYPGGTPWTANFDTPGYR